MMKKAVKKEIGNPGTILSKEEQRKILGGQGSDDGDQAAHKGSQSVAPGISLATYMDIVPKS
jgi:hypothetical protein